MLAGGGMRVAWQTGVIAALEEEGIRFDHIDGSSGGIMTAGMMLSGLSAPEMLERWLHVHVPDFSSMLPLKDYLTGPWNLPALSGPEGIVDKVFPALGIDVDAIRSSPLQGTFNVTDFTEKRCVPIDAHDIDAELMAAGMSLPIFTTPLRRDGKVWTDAAWIKDANVEEALRRGADEVWLVWCIGNSPYWGDGPLEQYVHMIEMSAAGGLLADFAWAEAGGREFVLHVVKPEHPLPLDPEFYTGRIDAHALIGMGYRDARRYLCGRTSAGVAPDVNATAMTDAPPGARWRERLTGDDVVLTLTVELPSDVASPGSVTGTLRRGPKPESAPAALLARGEVEIDPDADTWTYRGAFRDRGSTTEHELAVVRRLGSGGVAALHDAMTARLLIDGVDDRELHLRTADALAMVESLQSTSAHGLMARAEAVAAVAGRGLHALVTGDVE
ncbi:hypothetical protein GCM10027568_24860 [Humibacter soli]